MPNIIFIGSNLRNGNIFALNLDVKNEQKFSILSIDLEYPKQWLNWQ
ncbi:hypothetical protein ACGTJS_00250 [Faucicola mancuniensis]